MTDMSRSLRAGDVLCVLNYAYDDGTKSDSKFFIVYGFHKGHVAGFLTTSQEKGGRTRLQGCHAGRGYYPWNYYFNLAGSPFKDGTWVILDIEWWPLSQVESWFLQHATFLRLTLKTNVFGAIKNCFKSSSSYAPVCEEYQNFAKLSC